MISDIIKAFNSYGEASQYLTKPWAIKYVIISALLSLVTLAAFISVIVIYGDNILNLFPWEISIAWLQSVIEWIIIIALILGLLFIFKYIILIITAPVMSLLSESVEIHLTTNTIPHLGIKDQIKSMARGTALALSNIIREILITIPLLIMSLIPGFAVVTTPLLFAVQSYYAGFGNFDFFMERRYNIRQSRIFMNMYKGYAIGNGFIFLALLFIPIIGILIAPSLSTIAATLNAIKLIDK